MFRPSHPACRHAPLAVALIVAFGCSPSLELEEAVEAMEATPQELAVGSFEAESMSYTAPVISVLTTSTASNGKYLAIRGAAQAKKSLSLSQRSTALVVRARGVDCAGAPVMAVKVDGTVVGTRTISASVWTDYTIQIPLAAGSHTLILATWNDFKSASCTRALHVDRVVLEQLCVPTSCSAQGAECGAIPDGCGGTLSCGDCTAPETCGGGGAANLCGCIPTTCDVPVARCGSVSDGCGGTLACGACVSAADPTIPIASNVSGVGELSGLIGSVAHPGFLWAHRDGYAADQNSRVRLYAMKLVNGALVAFSGSSGPVREFTFNGTGTTIKNINWEDLALGVNVSTNSGSSLYIGDIGNNSGGRNAYQVYQFAEPDPDGASTTITVQATWKFQYPASAMLAAGEYPNCETMFLLDRYLYIVTKENQPRVYRFPDNYFASPGTTHTLVQVTNGSTTRVVGAPGNPSYGQFNPWRDRFMMGNHGSFKVWALGSNSLTGDQLVRQMLLNPSLPPAFVKQIDPTPGSSALNTEGGTWQYDSNDLVLGTESKMVYLWPASAYEK